MKYLPEENSTLNVCTKKNAYEISDQKTTTLNVYTRKKNA